MLPTVQVAVTAEPNLSPEHSHRIHGRGHVQTRACITADQSQFRLHLACQGRRQEVVDVTDDAHLRGEGLRATLSLAPR